jgi:hypothetical protein
MNPMALERLKAFSVRHSFCENSLMSRRLC